jgi:hypothetical protein
MGTYVMLDLKAFLNNRGCTLLSENHLGSLSLGGSSLPTEEFPFGKTLTVDTVPFAFAQTETGNDNMECTEQTIPLSPCVVKQLHVLGTSSNTDLFDSVSFLYKGTIVHQGRLYLSSFTSSEPAFTDRSVLTFSALHTRAGRYDHIKPHLWYCSLPLAQPQIVDSLQFEDNPSMHIFALTIESE